MTDLNIDDIKFIMNSKELACSEKTLAELGIANCTHIYIIKPISLTGSGYAWLCKDINIKFIKTSNKNDNKNLKCQLNSLLKLCLLKEISSKLNINELKMFPEMIIYKMKIMKNGYITSDKDIKYTIKKVLRKIEGSNIINFSEFVDEIINANHIEKMINLLNKDQIKEINDIKYRLQKYDRYMEFFMKNFEKAKKESIFGFSIVSLVIIERKIL